MYNGNAILQASISNCFTADLNIFAIMYSLLVTHGRLVTSLLISFRYLKQVKRIVSLILRTLPIKQNRNGSNKLNIHAATLEEFLH